MNREDFRETSPIILVYHELKAIHPSWYVEIGEPSGAGWISGTDLRTAREGLFNVLLSCIGERLHTSDRRTITASFAMRFGWSSGVAIAPFIICQCIPNIRLDNVPFKFHENTTCERAALHQPEGAVLVREGMTAHPFIQLLPNQSALVARLRASLIQQAGLIVEALYE
jgi:hypothetical protein